MCVRLSAPLQVLKHVNDFARKKSFYLSLSIPKINIKYFSDGTNLLAFVIAMHCVFCEATTTCCIM